MLVDRSVEHLWFSQEDACNVFYHGRVVRVWVKKNGVHSVRLAYWLDSESEEDCEDHHMPLSTFVTDLVLGDLILN